MTSKIHVRFIVAAAVVAAIAACKPSATVGSPGTTAAPAANRVVVPSAVTAASVAEGKTLVENPANNCSRCHGAGVAGGQRGPSLVDSTWAVIDGSFPEIVRIINEGVPAAKLTPGFTTPMPPKGRAALTDAQVSSIAAYLWSATHPH